MANTTNGLTSAHSKLSKALALGESVASMIRRGDQSACVAEMKAAYYRVGQLAHKAGQSCDFLDYAFARHWPASSWSERVGIRLDAWFAVVDGWHDADEARS